jgi:cytochrome P450
MNPYFSMAHVRKAEPDIERIVALLCSRFEEAKGTGQPINLTNAFKSMAADVATGFAFRKSYNLLREPDLAAGQHAMTRTLARVAAWHRHFGFILQLFEAMPRWLTAATFPACLPVLDYFAVRLYLITFS